MIRLATFCLASYAKYISARRRFLVGTQARQRWRRKSWFACTAFFWEESEFEFACTIMMETCQICYKTKVAGRTVVSGPNVKCFNLKEVKDTCCSTETIRIFDPGGEELLSVEVNGHHFAADLFDQLMPLVIPRGFVLSDGLQLSLYAVHNEERVFYRDVILGGLDLNLYVSEPGGAPDVNRTKDRRSPDIQHCYQCAMTMQQLENSLQGARSGDLAQFYRALNNLVDNSDCSSDSITVVNPKA